MRRVLVLFLLLVLVLAGCEGKRMPLSPEEFREKAEAAGFILEDITIQFEIEEGAGLELYLEFSQGSAADFCLGRFILYKKEKQAAAFYAQREAWIKDNEAEIAPLAAAAGKNFAYQIYSFRGQYQAVSWLGNSVIVIAAAGDKTEELDQFLQELGYKN